MAFAHGELDRIGLKAIAVWCLFWRRMTSSPFVMRPLLTMSESGSSSSARRISASASSCLPRHTSISLGRCRAAAECGATYPDFSVLNFPRRQQSTCKPGKSLRWEKAGFGAYLSDVAKTIHAADSTPPRWRWHPSM